MDRKRVGQILKEAREAKKLAVRDVAKETKISVKFILALENEDYAQFPGETFALGFLRNYSDYLKTDTGALINLYKGEKIEESQVPLEELTKPTIAGFGSFDKFRAITVLGTLAVLFSVYLIFKAFEGNDSSFEDEHSSEVSKEKTELPRDLTFVSQSVPENTSVPFILTSERGVSFSVSNQQCNIFIKSAKENSDPSQNKAVIGFNIASDRKIYSFETKVGDETVLTNSIPELSTLRRDIRILTQAITGKSAKLLITLSEEKAGTVKKPVGDVPIQVALYFLKSSYLEYILDGQMGERGLVAAGEVRQLEAKDRLEIKVGDGGAVEMVQNGKDKVRLGKPGKLVKKVYYKAPSLYDSTQYTIKELGE
ncbi:MAG: helix-turn-helix domain-containing protein [Leptospiraceae bacterium]|nr:helix-turn-helix domain-containing protein [Leptospiraceae bacterium]MCK6379766.1 helix-turn-helix domain-containing protein [Leptospiraceae bacterium]NUM41226.1 helix-turn-helix domain-containing protein [Leptospiraceae bacterium]